MSRTPFRDLPIAQKALILGIVPTVTAILFVVVSSMLSTYLQAQTNMTGDLDAESILVAENVSAAVAFDDAKTAESALRGYRSKSNIEAVCVFDSHGRLFTSYSRRTGGCAETLLPPSSNDAAITRDAPVLAGNSRIGTVRVVGNFSRLRTWIVRQAWVGFLTFCVGLLVSLLVTRRLARDITRPVQHLASTAQKVSETQDYTIRATKTTDDEVGHLVGSFNSMLDQIHAESLRSAKMLEREQEAGRLKDQFLATMSHELRTPLNAILGWIQIIKTTNPNRQTLGRAIDSVERNAQAQARVIEDLIDVARVTTGKLQLHPATIDMRNVVQAAFNVIDPAAKSKGVRLVMTLPDIPCPVFADADRLQQVIWNLASNAVKFTPEGGTVTVQLTNADRQLRLSVSDTGIGISPEFLPFVFEKFRQADGSMTREHGGLGLGLAIAKDLAELHGGSLSAVSGGRGKGATFTLQLPSLPLLMIDATAPRAASSALSQATRSLQGIRVLVVDDDLDSLNIVAEGVRAAGAFVETSASGADALEKWKERHSDVVVCDLAMPYMDGFDLIRTIRSTLAADEPLLALALSAHTLEADRQRAFLAGFDQHIAKPLNLDVLIDAIATHSPNTR